jgi:hypothetical protein
MNYYYYRIDGKINGPFSAAEIASINLSKETPVLKKHETEWKIFSDFEELCKISLDKSDTKIKEVQIIRIPKKQLIYLTYPLAILIALLITYLQKENDLFDFKKRIDELLNGNNSICDYYNLGEEGQLHDVYLQEAKFNGISLGYSELKTNKFSLVTVPSGDEDINDPKWGNYNKSKIEKWNKLRNIKQYFESYPLSGFNMSILIKEDDRYIFKNIWSGDMAYYVPEKKYYPGYQSEYYSSPGYSISTYRPSIEKCYEEAAEFIINEEGYKKIKDVFSKINSFPYMTSKFYKLDQDYFQYLRGFDSIYIKYEKDGKFNPVINQNPITKRTNLDDARIYNSQWIVWYKEISNNYKIATIKYSFIKALIINSLLCCLVMGIIHITIRFKRKIVFE